MDTDVLYKVIDSQRYPYAIPETIMKLKHKEFYVFTNDKETVIGMAEPVYGGVPWLNAHVHSSPEHTGRELMEMFTECAKWLVRKTNVECITTVIRNGRDQRGLRIFMGHFGADRLRETKSGVMYALTREQIEETL